MSEMAKFSYLTLRKGSQNWYYKRDLDPDLWAEGRPKQKWRSLRTPDRKKAEAAYAEDHADIERLIARGRREDGKSSGASATSAGALPIIPLTPALLRRLAEAH